MSLTIVIGMWKSMLSFENINYKLVIDKTMHNAHIYIVKMDLH